VNAADILKYGHMTVMHTIDGLSEEDCDVGGVCGIWSVRQIMAHLTSHELIIVDVLNSFLNSDTPTPYLSAYGSQGLAFNDIEVAKRKQMSFAETVNEYAAAYAQAHDLIVQIPVEKRRQVGTLPWYGAEYDLEDAIAYSVYGHKREHSAQINVYRDQLKAQAKLFG
jgi:DinB superfamily